MKFSSLFLLALPLASAVRPLSSPFSSAHRQSFSLQHGLKARQDATETANEVGEALSQADPSNAADCLTICSMAAMADSVSRPSFVLRSRC